MSGHGEQQSASLTKSAKSGEEAPQAVKLGTEQAAATAACQDDVFDMSKNPHALHIALLEQGQKQGDVNQAIDVANMSTDERIKFLAADVKKGGWSEDGKKVWSQIFGDIRRSLPGATNEDIQKELIARTAREVNKLSIADNVNRIVQFAQTNRRDAQGKAVVESNFYMQIYGDNIDNAANARALTNPNPEVGTTFRVGQINWGAEKEAYQKDKAALVETLKTESLAGTWSDKGKRACRQLFDLMRTQPDGTTIRSITSELKGVSNEITASLKAQGSQNFVDAAAVLTENNVDSEFFLIVSKDRADRQKTLADLQKGAANDSYVKAGAMNMEANGNVLKADEYQRGVLLGRETTQGFWSGRSQQTLKRLFNDLTERPGMDAAGMKAILKAYTEKLNEGLQEKIPGSKVILDSRLDLKTGGTAFTMQLDIADPQTKRSTNAAANEQALKEGKDTRTSVRLGTMRLRPMEAEKKPQA